MGLLVKMSFVHEDGSTTYPPFTVSGLMHPAWVRHCRKEGFDPCRLCAEQTTVMAFKGTGGCCAEHLAEVERLLVEDAKTFERFVERTEREPT